MTRDELWNLPAGDPPVMLPDGKVGLLTVFPSKYSDDELCGVQVPGEQEHRWYHRDNISALSGAALIAKGDAVRR